MYCLHTFQAILLSSVTVTAHKKGEIMYTAYSKYRDGSKHLKWNSYNFPAIRYPSVFCVCHGNIC